MTFLMEKEHYLLNNRNSDCIKLAFSIASSWIWAPALIISGQKGFSHGIIGAASFLIPNALTLILFGIFAKRLANKTSKPITITEIILGHYESKRIYAIYLFQQISLQICCLSVQFLAISKILTIFFGINSLTVSLILALVPLYYILRFGLIGSLISDYIKLIILLLILMALCPFVLFIHFSHINLQTFFWGISNKTHSLLDKSNIQLLFEFIIPSSIGLISGPFGDQAFYQRAFAIKKSKIFNAFLLSSLLFSIVPLSLSILGMISNSIVDLATNQEFPHFLLIKTSVSPIIFYFFIIIIIFALISAIDSHLTAISCIGGHDIWEMFKDTTNKSYLQVSRILIICSVLLAILIASIPNLKILHLFLFYGTLRSSTFYFTLSTIRNKKLTEKSVFWSIVLTFSFCLPFFTWANLTNHIYLISISSLSAILLPFFFSTKIKLSL